MCRSKHTCRECRSRHHTLVHPAQSSSTAVHRNSRTQPHTTSSNPPQAGPVPSTSLSTSSTSLINNHLQHYTSNSHTILPTAIVNIPDIFGQLQPCRLLLDSGSQASFISETCVRRLGIPRKNSRIPITALAGTGAGTTRGIVTVDLVSRFSSDSVQVNAYILSKLTTHLPSRPLSLANGTQYSSLQLADPTFTIPSPIDILLGIDKMFHVLKADIVPGQEGCPDAISTIFGWVIGGEATQLLPHSQTKPTQELSSLHTTIDVDKSLRRFWELEEVETTLPMTEAEQTCENHFQTTHTRAPDGKYMVELPFQNENIDFGNSLHGAIQRQLATENRFQRNPHLKDQYCRFMAEYLSLHHMVEIPKDEIEKPSS